MRILLITPFYNTGGRADLRHDTDALHYFAKYWSAENEVKVFNIYPHSYKDMARYCSRENRTHYAQGYVFTKDGVEVFIAEVQKFPGQKGTYLSFQTRHILKLFKRWMYETGFVPDVILAHVPSYAYTFLKELKNCFAKDIPALGILHKTDIEELERNKQLKEKLEESFAAVYARSHGIRRKAQQYGLHNLKMDIIQSGVPLDERGEQRAPYIVKDNLRIVYAGKLIELKHVDTIINALAQIHTVNIHLDVLGTGPEEQRLRELVKRLGLESKVTFAGMVDRETVVEFMGNANLYCMPSFPETLGLTYLEAMSVGCVPIGTRGEGIDGIVEDGKNGYLVDPENLLDSVVQKIQSYISLSDNERKVLSENAQSTVKDLDEPKCAEKYLEIVKSNIM